MTPSLFVDRAPDLAELGQPLESAHELYLDTECMRELTAYPQLCLSQLATSQQVVCVDPLALEDLSLIDNLLAQPNIRKILHAARQDIEVLLNRCPQTPAN